MSGCWIRCLVTAVSLLTSSAAFAVQVSVTTPGIALPVKCRFSEPSMVITTLKKLPDVIKEFDKQHLKLADIGEPFVPFDVSDDTHMLPHRQFMMAYVFSKRTIIWYYHGGVVTNVHVVELAKQQDTFEQEPRLHITGRNFMGPPCKATQAILDGVQNFQTSDW